MNNYQYGYQQPPMMPQQTQQFAYPAPRTAPVRQQYRISQNSRFVFSKEEFDALPADLDGSLVLAPDLNNKTIWAKQFDAETGRVDAMQFALVPPPAPPEYVRADTFAETINELKTMIAGLSENQKQPRQTNKRKDVTADVVPEHDAE